MTLFWFATRGLQWWFYVTLFGLQLVVCNGYFYLEFIRCEEHRQIAWTVDHLVKKCSSVFSVLRNGVMSLLRFMYILLVNATTHLLPKPQRRVGVARLALLFYV